MKHPRPSLGLMQKASDNLRRIGRAIEGERSQCLLTRWVFLRLLGIIYLVAFVSLWLQIDGLIGAQGILPVADHLKALSGRLGAERYWWFPTFCWLNPSDGCLQFQCAAGVVFSLLLMAGVAPQMAAMVLWADYLSLSTACQEFLSFQWDILLLETGFLAVFFAPRQLLPRLSRESPPSLTVLWLFRWLLFRLMFMSGAVKLLSGDSTWWNLSALTFHYETQPLPTWVGWYAHQLPVWFQKVSVILMFGIELLVPLLIFCGRRARQIAAGGFAVFMLLILLTGNYCFFNLLTVALCLLLLDDRFLSRLLPTRLIRSLPPSDANGGLAAFRVASVGVLALAILSVSTVQTAARWFGWEHLPRRLLQVAQGLSPLRSINSYGLFAVMTTPRPEIIVEGSNDGVVWLPYEFKWKPGDLKRPPAFVQPHQPRLDWQMWFAALGSYRSNPWFINFLARLLQGAPRVLALLEKNPFPDKPPRYVRAILYEYHFTDSATRARTGEWWRRDPKGLYCPELSMRQP